MPRRTHSLHSRRDALKYFCASTTLAAGSSALAETVLAGNPRYFPLRDVRLGAGPFLDAQNLNGAYLLRLEPDRLLHNFRANAGLEPRAPVYGGWESVEPWIDIRCHGHTLGHYLGAAASMYVSTGDERYAQRVDYLVAELAECQARTGGWLSAFPDGVAPLTDSLAGKPFAGVPWYTLHKILAGLRDAHLHRGSAQARQVFLGLVDWIDRACAEVPDDRLQKMLDREHGGMNEVLADAFELTGEARYLKLAQRFSHRKLLEPLLWNRDALDGLHANTQIPKVVGFQRIGELGSDSEWSSAALKFWMNVVRKRSYATGGHGDVELFFPVQEFAKRLHSGKTMETCCTHNMLRLTRALNRQMPSRVYLDYFERALFNGILASQDPLTGMNTYFQSTRPGYARLYHTPFDSFWCCTGSGLENHARYGETLYAHDGDTLYVNLFLSSALQWRERGFTVVQQTRFPDSDRTQLRFEGGPPRRLTLAVRHPGWCAQMSVKVNGRRVRTEEIHGFYRRFTREFRAGDVVEIHLPMTLRAEPLPNAPEYAALVYGPIVLAGRLGTQGLTPGSQLIVNERESGQMLQADVKIPAWTQSFERMVASTRRTHPDRLEFRTTGFAEGASMELAPWFRLTHERYNLYWQRA